MKLFAIKILALNINQTIQLNKKGKYNFYKNTPKCVQSAYIRAV